MASRRQRRQRRRRKFFRGVGKALKTVTKVAKNPLVGGILRQASGLVPGGRAAFDVAEQVTSRLSKSSRKGRKGVRGAMRLLGALQNETMGLTPDGTKYVVEDDDYAWKISEKLVGTGQRWKELRDANPQKKPWASDGNFRTLWTGEILNLPTDWQSAPLPAPDEDEPDDGLPLPPGFPPISLPPILTPPQLPPVETPETPETPTTPPVSFPIPGDWLPPGFPPIGLPPVNVPPELPPVTTPPGNLPPVTIPPVNVPPEYQPPVNVPPGYPTDQSAAEDDGGLGGLLGAGALAAIGAVATGLVRI